MAERDTDTDLQRIELAFSVAKDYEAECESILLHALRNLRLQGTVTKGTSCVPNPSDPEAPYQLESAFMVKLFEATLEDAEKLWSKLPELGCGAVTWVRDGLLSKSFCTKTLWPSPSID